MSARSSTRRKTWQSPYYPRPTAVGDAYTAYCAYVQKRWRHMRVLGHPGRARPVSVTELYTPLSLSERPVARNAEEEALTTGGHDLLWCLHRSPMLVVAGPPGSGKSTLLHQLACDLSARLTSPITRALPDHLPVPLSLRSDSLEGREQLQDLIDDWLLEVSQATGMDTEPLQPFFEQGRWLILLDGLEQLGTMERRRRLWQWLAQHQQQQPDKGFYLVTSRPSGLAGLQLTATGRSMSADMRLLPIAGAADSRSANTRSPISAPATDTAGVRPTGTIVHIRPLSLIHIADLVEGVVATLGRYAGS